MSLDPLCRLTGLVGVALFFAAAFTPLAHALSLWMAVEPQLVRSDAIVVLGATVSRARPLFEHAGFEVHAAPSDTYFEPTAPGARLTLMRGLLQEVLG